MSVGRRQWAVIAAICAVVALLAWYALARAGSGGPDDGGVGPGADPSASPTATLFPPVAAAGSVLSPLDPAAAQPDAAVLASVLAPFLTDEDLGSRVTASVVDAATGAVLLDQQAQLALTPASTAKLMTGLAALDVLGPERRVATSVVTGASADQIVLVGRGDSMLATSATPPEAYPQRASLDDLAARTAAALVARGLTSVSLGYDAGFFAGPLANPSWQPSYVATGQVAPVSALMVDGGRVEPGSNARVADPARVAADRFAEALVAAGVGVVSEPVPALAGPDAELIAEVLSPTIAQTVETMLVESDNDLAEALFRLVGAQSSTPSSVEASAAAVVDAAGTSGVPVEGVTLRDGSGLSRSSAIPARTLSVLLDVAADDPLLGGLLPGLPVAGYTGTLDDRFDNADDRAGAGKVRAKTGTLNGVSSLSGTVVSADGRLLAFAFMADQVPIEATLDARAALDAAATALTGCGCR